MRPLTRRSFLAGTAGLTLAACGGGGSTGTKDLSLVRFFPDGVMGAGLGPQRLVVGLGDNQGVLTSGGPDAITARILLNGQQVGRPVTSARHAANLPRPYWAFVAPFDQPGQYTLSASVEGKTIEAPFTIVDAKAVTLVKPGDTMPAVVTPTTADGHGVNPICTRSPACSLHDVTLADALKGGKPVAFLVATPAYCQTAACGPVLDVVISQVSGFASKIHFLHAEVYTDTTLKSTSPAVDQLRLPFEPVLYLVGADGVVKNRLDSLFDANELSGALSQLVS